MAPKKAKTVKRDKVAAGRSHHGGLSQEKKTGEVRHTSQKTSHVINGDQKHGKNGKKEGLSGSSFFTWFMVIALLGVWTSVAVVWFDLVDYEEFLGKLGDYDADGDGDFDVDDAKVLLGLKERIVSKKISEDLDETDSIQSDFSDADLQYTLDAMKDSPPLDDDIFDLEDALDDHETQYDTVSEFSLEDAVEPSVHASLTSEPELKEEPVIEEQVVDEVIEEVWEQEPTADHDDDDDDVEEATLTFEDKQAEYQEPEYEEEVEETETEFLNAPNTGTKEPVEDVEYKAAPLAVEEPAHVAGKEPEAALAPEEHEPQDEYLESNQEPEVLEKKYEYHEESDLMGEEDLNEPAEDETSYEEVNEYSPEIELEEEEPAELSDDPDGDTVPEETEETSEADEDTIEGTEEFVIDSDEINAHEHVEVEQNEIPENPVVNDRPSERVEEQDRHTLEGQQGEHADT